MGAFTVLFLYTPEVRRQTFSPSQPSDNASPTIGIAAAMFATIDWLRRCVCSVCTSLRTAQCCLAEASGAAGHGEGGPGPMPGCRHSCSSDP